jgi:predicted alpha/beta-fold hydrolase
VAYTRVWFEAPAMGDGAGSLEPAAASSAAPPETLALDWSFPKEGGFDERRPIAIVLHGLNGGSAEPLVLDFVEHATSRLGWTCAVMIARGLAGAASTSGVPFNGARTTDAAACVELVRGAAPEGTPLIGVGYSMGAIVLSHYVASMGERCPLQCAVSISGSPDVPNGTMPHAQRLWQPPLAHELKRTFLRQRALIYKGRVDIEHVKSSRVPHITSFDEQVRADTDAPPSLALSLSPRSSSSLPCSLSLSLSLSLSSP